MVDFDYGLVADTLLALCERSQDAPFYGEEYFERKERKAEQRGEVLYLNFALLRRDDELFQRECDAIFELAKLTPKQATVVRQRLAGSSFDSIGSGSGTTKQSSQRIFMQGIKKLARSLHVYPYRGLSEVYRRETRRGRSHNKAA